MEHIVLYIFILYFKSMNISFYTSLSYIKVIEHIVLYIFILYFKS